MVEEPPLKDFTMSDLGNGERFARQHAGKVIRAADDWWVYTHGRWKRDDTNAVERHAKSTIRAIYHNGMKMRDGREAMLKWAMTSESARGVSAMLQCARSEPAIARPVSIFDADQFALNVKNGTINLKTGELTPHNPSDHITKISPVTYDLAAEAPSFHLFLSQIFSGNTPLIAYVQKLLGMAATGECQEQILPIFWGDGSNGKSTLLETVQYVLGDYASEAPDSLLTMQKNGEHPTELADLMGRRLVVASETEESSRLRLQLVKKLTGQVNIKARRMHENYFEFRRTHHIILQTNHKPRIPEDTEAAWRRLRLVPFAVIIPEADRIKGLGDHIRDNEAPSVLRWLVEGCQLWLKEGLKAPPEVETATAAYREESDPIVEFIEDCCELNSLYYCGKGLLRKAYMAFCEERGVKPIGDRAFTEKIKGRGCTEARTKAERRWCGINLLNAPDGTYQHSMGGYQGE